MQKEEFPTFLNEQPTIILGRTGRELLIIVCGIVGGCTLWNTFNDAIATMWWRVVCLTLSVVIVLVSTIFSVIYVGGRPMEEWAAAWLTYILMPKIFIHKPLTEAIRDDEERKKGQLPLRSYVYLDEEEY